MARNNSQGNGSSQPMLYGQQNPGVGYNPNTQPSLNAESTTNMV